MTRNPIKYILFLLTIILGGITIIILELIEKLTNKINSWKKAP